MEFGHIVGKERRLNYNEHFVLVHLKRYMPYYCALWAVALASMFVLGDVCHILDHVTYESAQTLASCLMTLSILTITFAIPSSMRMIFATYDAYYSTTIKSILVERFPFTLLILSAFTSLVLSLSVSTGIWGTYLPDEPYHFFYVMMFWTGVCMVFLFVAIEKLIYFVVKAPGAVLEKLEFNVSNLKVLLSASEYNEFRHQLASINDIASTTVHHSTGQDDVIFRCLSAFEEIHAVYAKSLQNELPGDIRRRHIKACSAVDQEMVRIFRESCISKNEHAARSIIKTYCRIVAHSIEYNVPRRYFGELISKVYRFHSYAVASYVEELQQLASVDWFFYLDRCIDRVISPDVSASISRELASALRRLTLDDKKEQFIHFLRLASNASVTLDTSNMSEQWIGLMDRSMLIYLSWLMDSGETNAEEYAGYIRNYSSNESADYRSVLCDDPSRFELLVAHEDASLFDNAGDSTARIMSMDANEDISRSLALMVMAAYAGVDIKEAKGKSGLIRTAIDSVRAANTGNLEGFQDRVRISSVLEPSAVDLCTAGDDDERVRREKPVRREENEPAK